MLRDVVVTACFGVLLTIVAFRLWIIMKKPEPDKIKKEEGRLMKVVKTFIKEAILKIKKKHGDNLTTQVLADAKNTGEQKIHIPLNKKIEPKPSRGIPMNRTENPNKESVWRDLAKHSDSTPKKQEAGKISVPKSHPVNDDIFIKAKPKKPDSVKRDSTQSLPAADQLNNHNDYQEAQLEVMISRMKIEAATNRQKALIIDQSTEKGKDLLLRKKEENLLRKEGVGLLELEIIERIGQRAKQIKDDAQINDNRGQKKLADLRSRIALETPPNGIPFFISEKIPKEACAG
jgi:hypothetical protein